MNLYAHFPFCRSKCAYCALLSRAGSSAAARAAHCARLAREIAALDRTPRTVYFGGGTPALCDLAPVFEALRELHERQGGPPPDEFTVELHPLDVDNELLAALARGGVNRISLGVQSLDDEVLAAMGRGYGAARAEEAFRRVRDAFPNCGIDLIAGWPAASPDSWRRTVERAARLGGVHLSCYTLIREPGTAVDMAVRRGRLELPDDDAALDEFGAALDAFAAVGFRRYEVSSFALPGRECRHNLAIWRGEDYVGLGEGAHGRRGLERTVGTATGYEVSKVDALHDAEERALMRLRIADGLAPASVAREFPVLATKVGEWTAYLESLVAPGIVDRASTGAYVLTRRGLEVCDSVSAELCSAEC